MKNKYIVRALIALFVSHIIWGLSTTFAKMALSYARPFVVLAYRFLIAFLTLNVLMLFGKGKLNLKGKNIFPLICMGTFEPVGYFILSHYGLLQASSIISGILNSLVPVLALISSSVFLKERPSKAQVLFSILSIISVLIITLQETASGSTTVLGVILIAVAMVCSVGYGSIGRISSTTFTVFERTYVTFSLGASVFIVCAFIENRHDLGNLIAPLQYPPFLIGVLFMGILGSVVAYMMLSYAQNYMPIYKTASFLNLSTAVVIIGGILFLKEEFNLVSLICSIVIIGCIWGIQKFSPKNESMTYVKKSKNTAA